MVYTVDPRLSIIRAEGSPGALDQVRELLDELDRQRVIGKNLFTRSLHRFSFRVTGNLRKSEILLVGRGGSMVPAPTELGLVTCSNNHPIPTLAHCSTEIPIKDVQISEEGQH